MRAYSLIIAFIISLNLLHVSTLAQVYTLQDTDVVIENGVILSCSYDFSTKNIIIPESLQGQIVIGITGVEINTPGVFSGKGIKTVEFPAAIQFIGDRSFNHNVISNLDLSALSTLERIGEMSFQNNEITQLTTTNCISLQNIGHNAFEYNEIEILDLSQCTSLNEIGGSAFEGNKISELNLNGCISLKHIACSAFRNNLIDQLYLTNCPSLLSIDVRAFNSNNISNLDISNCGGLAYIGSQAFGSNNLSMFTLPSCTGYETYGWKDENGNLYASASTVTDFNKLYFVNFTYSLTDEDVIVENSIIQSCSYDFKFKSVEIPESLDGQLIKGIRDREYGEGVFSRKNIVEIKLPATIEHVGNHSFKLNNIYFIDLSSLINLSYIGDHAFGLYLMNNLFDLSNLNSLEYIGVRALGFSNDIVLPVCTSYQQYGWMNSNGESIAAGSTITYYDLYYYVPYPYTLKDEDVTIETGIIKSCTYSFIRKDIIIPETLQQQSVTGIGESINPSLGVFYSKGLSSIKIPTTIKFIGKGAFFSNELDAVDLSDCISLERICDNAFKNNSITNLNLQNCTALEEIGNYSFYGHSMTSLDLSLCPNLTTIGEYAFVPGWNSGSKIETTDLSGCEKLQSVSSGAFKDNDMETVDLSDCISLSFIGRNAFNNNQFNSFVLPHCDGYEEYGWHNQNGDHFSGGTNVTDLSLLYYIAYDYTLEDDDVIIEDGVIDECLYDFQFKSVIIPEVLQGQTVIQLSNKSKTSNNLFGGKDLVKIQLPSTIEIIGDYTFANNDFVDLDFSNCSSLLKIGFQSFTSIFLLNELDLTGCSSLEYIDNWAFMGNYCESINLSNCNSLFHIGAGAFGENGPDEFQLPVCNGFESLGWMDNYGNTYMGGDMVMNNWGSPYYVPFLQYTLKDYNVEVESGFIQTCSYAFSIKDIIIPDNLHQQQIIGIAGKTDSLSGVFASKGISDIKIPNTLLYLGDYSLNNNQLNEVDLSSLSHLLYIGANSLSDNIFEEIILPDPVVNGFDYWEDENGNKYYNSATVSDLTTSYYANSISQYSITFNIQDQNGNAIEESIIEFNLETKSTNGNGLAVFEDVMIGNYEYQVTKAGYITKTASITITNDTTVFLELMSLAIDENVQSGSISIYPNPASDNINFNISLTPLRVDIVNLVGELIYSGQHPANTSIDLTSLKPGIYILKIVCENHKVFTGKFVKK